MSFAVPLRAPFGEDTVEKFAGWFDVGVLLAPVFGKFAFDSSFEDGSFIALEAGLDAFEVGDGVVETGELLFDLCDDAFLLFLRREWKMELPEKLEMATISATWDSQRTQDIIKKLWKIGIAGLQNLDALGTHCKWCINEFDRACVVAKKNNWQLTVKSHLLVVGEAANGLLTLIDDGNFTSGQIRSLLYSPALIRDHIHCLQKGLETLQWRADDENDDELTYEVNYRREGDSTWKVLRKNLSETILVWDTTTVPNGTYFVRVIASDAPSNSGATALTGELDSNAFDVDNTPPVFSAAVARIDGTRTLVAVDVRDDQSAISKVEYSQNGEEWTAVFPTDGIADSRAEHYEIAIDGRVGPRGITLRAIDAMNNVSTTQVEVSAPAR